MNPNLLLHSPRRAGCSGPGAPASWTRPAPPRPPPERLVPGRARGGPPGAVARDRLCGVGGCPGPTCLWKGGLQARAPAHRLGELCAQWGTPKGPFLGGRERAPMDTREYSRGACGRRDPWPSGAHLGLPSEAPAPKPSCVVPGGVRDPEFRKVGEGRRGAEALEWLPIGRPLVISMELGARDLLPEGSDR